MLRCWDSSKHGLNNSELDDQVDLQDFRHVCERPLPVTLSDCPASPRGIDLNVFITYGY